MLPISGTSHLVPAQKRPWQSTAPSLKQVWGLSASGSAIKRSPWVCGSQKAKPFFVAITKPPEARKAKIPIGTPTSKTSYFPVVGDKREKLFFSISTQYNACSSKLHTGPSP